MSRFKLSKIQFGKVVKNVKLKTPLELAIANTIRDQQKWLDKEMKRISPPNIYKAATDGTPEGAAVAKLHYFNKGIRIVESQGGMSKQIWEGDKMISEFKFMGLEKPNDKKTSQTPE